MFARIYKHDTVHVLLESGKLYTTSEYSILFKEKELDVPFVEMNGLYAPSCAFEEYGGVPGCGSIIMQVSGGWDTLPNLTQALSYMDVPYLETDEQRLQEVMERLKDDASREGVHGVLIEYN
jgi:hypothetical protein